MNIFTKTALIFASPLRGAFLVGLLLVGSAAVALVPAEYCPPHPPTKEVTMSGELSQKTFVQGESTQTYLTVKLSVPETPSAGGAHSPVDLVIVLDRSGSMSDPKKLPFAKQAIQNLLYRLNSKDMVSLIAFDQDVRTLSPLRAVTPDTRSELLRIVEGITPGGSTNISGGLDAALAIARASSRARKVVLLTDGEANVGVINTSSLAQYGKSFVTKESSLSAVGLGLGFNESLLAQMADYGMGSYSFLGDLTNLSAVLDKNLAEARDEFASSSSLNITLNEGVSLTDASGFPIEWLDSNRRHIKIPTGTLLAGNMKSITLELTVLSQEVGQSSLGSFNAHYTRDGSSSYVAVPSGDLVFATVSPEKRTEAYSTINKEAAEKGWFINKWGAVQKKVQESLRSGDRVQAQSAIADYKRALLEAEVKSGGKLRAADASAPITSLAQKVEDSFTGSTSEQADKRNKNAKELLDISRGNQRK